VIVAIHQPNYIPWAGFFHKVLKTDAMVLLDNVQYVDKSWSNRNWIKTPNGPLLLSVPVRLPRYDMPFKDVQIDSANPTWGRKHWRTLTQAYLKAPFFRDFSSFLEEAYSTRWNLLIDFNIALIGWTLRCLGAESRLLRASQMQLEGSSNELLINICKYVGADEFLSGSGCFDYIRPEMFRESGIEIYFQDFQCPIYAQLHGPFVPNLSILDMLFNVGRESAQLIRQWQRTRHVEDRSDSTLMGNRRASNEQ